MSEACRLCGSAQTRLFFEGGARAHDREFHQCASAHAACDLVFVPDRFLLSQQAERERYVLHENDPADEGYRAHLRNLLDEIAPLLPPGAEGLDYGCGEPPVLVMMLRERGLRAEGWDLFFSPDAAPLERARERPYDFVTCSETAEHFRAPLTEFERLNRLLRPGGVLGVMTQMLDDWSAFGDWHYRFDATHISFYSARTMRWLAKRFGWSVNFPREHVTVFRKPG